MTLTTSNTKPGRSKNARARKQLTADQLFFFEHAGYSYDPKKETAYQGRMRCAKEIAEAEATAQRLDWTFNWDYDPEGCSGCDCDSNDCPCSAQTEHETLNCWVEDAEGKTLASLGSICGADTNYRRVVEAELAEEALYDYDREIETLDAH
jgi:hypothetical protein